MGGCFKELLNLGLHVVGVHGVYAGALSELIVPADCLQARA
jgi:hypothetical protein